LGLQPAQDRVHWYT